MTIKQQLIKKLKNNYKNIWTIQQKVVTLHRF